MHLLAGYRVCIACREHRRPPDVATLLTYRLGTAKNHIVDQFGVQPIATRHGPQYMSRQLDSGYFMQSTARFALAARRAHVVVYECLLPRYFGLSPGFAGLVWPKFSRGRSVLRMIAQKDQ